MKAYVVLLEFADEHFLHQFDAEDPQQAVRIAVDAALSLPKPFAFPLMRAIHFEVLPSKATKPEEVPRPPRRPIPVAGLIIQAGRYVRAVEGGDPEARTKAEMELESFFHHYDVPLEFPISMRPTGA